MQNKRQFTVAQADERLIHVMKPDAALGIGGRFGSRPSPAFLSP